MAKVTGATSPSVISRHSTPRPQLLYFGRSSPASRIGVIGVSLGGAATLLGPRPLPVAALVLEQVFPDIDRALTNRLVTYIGPLGRWVAPVYEWVMPFILPIRPEQLRPIDHIGELTAPLLMLAGAEDRYTPLSESRALFARAPEPKQLVAIAGAGHVDLAAYAPEDYRRRVLSFLAGHLSRRD